MSVATATREVEVTPVAPILSVEKSESMGHMLRIADPAKARARRPVRPVGVDGYEIYFKVGGSAPRSREECEYWGLARRSRVFVALPEGSEDQTVWYMAVPVDGRWRRGARSDVIGARVAA